MLSVTESDNRARARRANHSVDTLFFGELIYPYELRLPKRERVNE